MKIVINCCFGGFSLSHRAIMRYAELKGIKLYPWIDSIETKIKGNKIDFDEAMFINYTLVPQEEYEAITEMERDKPIGAGRYEKSYKLYFSGRDIPRNDPDLIKVIKELGKEANGYCANLKIINIPKDIKYTVEEYDGNEWIAEKHRTWRQSG